MPARESRGSSASVRFSRTDMSGTMPFDLAVLGAEADARGDRIGRPARREAAALEAHGTAIWLVGAEDEPHRLGAPGAEQTGKSDDLPRADAEVTRHAPRRADVHRLGRRGAILGGVIALAEGRRAGALHRAHVAPSMAATSSSLPISGHRRPRDRAAVAHDGDAVADGIELVELVADEDDRDALGA